MIQNLAMINVQLNNFNLFLLQLQNIIFLSNYIHFFNRLSVFTFYRFQQSLQITFAASNVCTATLCESHYQKNFFSGADSILKVYCFYTNTYTALATLIHYFSVTTYQNS